MNKTRIVFIGFQHPHIWDLVARATAHPDIDVIASCEEDEATRNKLADDDRVTITHTDYQAMLAKVECDAIVVGEWFAKRGRVMIDSLNAGRHVLADKPMCTTLAEHDEIVRIATEKNLTVGMMLDMRDSGVFIKVHELVRSGEIGEIQSISFGGQHPLLPGVRADWYHQEGKQGGSINDIALHGLDLIPWVTGLEFSRVNAARDWAVGVPEGSHFKNAGQCMMELENGAGMILDVSYVAPSSQGYTLPMYWRLTLWGSKGVLETSMTSKEILLCMEGEKTPRSVPIAEPNPGGYLEAFLREMRGESHDGVTQAEIFRASRVTLKAQETADRGLLNVDV
jgi:predicted dehydrogenase